MNDYNIQPQNNSSMALWLKFVCTAFICMIFIGGLTRLTESGLSITEWKPITGIVPPMNQNDWLVEFEKYQASPEFKAYNKNMQLEEFKSIYLLEFVHRIAGRITGMIYFFPLIFFYFRGYIKNRCNILSYLVVLVLFALQGLMGWYMVKSGLKDNPHVSHYRLATHLILAFVMYAILFWQLMKNSIKILTDLKQPNLYNLQLLLSISIILLFIQIFLGGLVAGLKAGLIYNDFPYMGGMFIPNEINLNSFMDIGGILGDPVFVQFSHRMMAYILSFVILIMYIIFNIKNYNAHYSRAFNMIIYALLLQLLLGILTLLYEVPIVLALLHQLGAIMLLSTLLHAKFLVQYN